MKKTIRTKILAGVLAAICVASAATIASVVSVSAQSSKSVSASAKATIVEKTSGSEFKLPLRGYDWNYYANSLNAKIGCDFDYQKNICNFNITAVKPGMTEAVLKTQEADGKWSNTPIKITVHKDMTMTIEQTGSAYLTDSYKTTEASTSAPASSSTAAKPAETTPAKPAASAASTKTGKSVQFPLSGKNWNYYANTLNAKITCDFDYSKSLCTFIITAVKPGVCDAVLKTKRADDKWDNTPVHITVDNELNVTVTQSANTYVTAKAYTE